MNVTKSNGYALVSISDGVLRWFPLSCTHMPRGRREGGREAWLLGGRVAVNGDCRAWGDPTYGREDACGDCREDTEAGPRGGGTANTSVHPRASLPLVRFGSGALVPGPPHGASSV